MAVFKSHYNLCPLLGGNHKLMGISSDKEEGTILVTLGPNIIVKHKLSDQKPLKSWSTRQSNQLTCQSVFDHSNEKYVGILNKKHVCMWSEEESNLEDVKKHTFSTNIHAIHSLPGKFSIIVFENGFSENLDLSLQKRKEEKPSLLEAGDTLTHSSLEFLKNNYILVLFTAQNKVYFIRLGSDGSPEGKLSFTLEKNNDTEILGKAVINDGQIITVLSLYSNGELVQYSEQGAVIATHNLTGISLSRLVAMVMLDATHVAIYGSDSSDEGAVLLLFDLKFGMSVATRKLKFFCNPPLLYHSAVNNVLLLCVVQNLVVVPYILQPSLLWNLIDSRQTPEGKSKPDVVIWSKTDVSEPTDQAPFPLQFRKPELTSLAQSIWGTNASNSRLFDELLPPLKEDKDLSGICLLLKSVKSLSEKWQADLLNFFLEQSDEFDEDHLKMLNLLLSIPYSDVVLLNHLRRKLTTKSTIKFIKLLSNLLHECQLSRDVASDLPTLAQIIDWISLVLDAHHHELLIAGSDDQVVKLIQGLGERVNENYEFLDCLGNSEPLLHLIQQNKKPPENRRKDWYAVEVVRLL